MRQYRLQKRQHPVFSPLALISTLILACGLAGWVYLTGGRVFSPGNLSAVNPTNQELGEFFSHADFGDHCHECHTPFKGIEAQRCEQCHTHVAEQRQTGQGLHSRFEKVETCGDCHQEHKGQQFDQFAAALVNFNHDITRFSLVKHVIDYQNVPLECTACHQRTGTEFTIVVSHCADCHQAAAADFMADHMEAFSDRCLDCHDGHDTMANFTLEAHDEVFALTGVHAVTACERCHTGGQFKETANACVACHTEPDTHAEMFGSDCATCHQPEGWLPAMLKDQPFDHAADTGFSLVTHVTNYDATAFTCRTCHTGSQPVSFTNSQCIDCHQPADPAFMADHITLFGENCMGCHAGDGELTHFDHNRVWLLDGQHATLQCTACHINKVFRGTARECVACHAEPAIHVGLFGTNCTTCHTTQAWQPARLTQHTFPLDHGEQGEIACITCHTITYTEYTCYNCHEHDPVETEHKHLEEGISREELPDCTRCHPTGLKTED